MAEPDDGKTFIPGLGRVFVPKKPEPVKSTPPPPTPTKSPEWGIPFGHYEVNGELYWFAYSKTRTWSGSPGTRVRKEIGGKWSDHVYPSEIKEVMPVIRADPLEAAISYGKVTGRCTRCDRPLTLHSSLIHSMGEDCYKKSFGGLV